MQYAYSANLNFQYSNTLFSISEQLELFFEFIFLHDESSHFNVEDHW